MVRRRVFPVWIVLLLILFLSEGFIGGACALTTEEEKKLGKKILQEMEGKIEILKDPALQGFIDRVGRSLVAQVGPTPFDFKFYLINAQDPNAFAIPGGHIFLNTGLIVLAENEHEVAGVISHEIAHVTERHVAQMIERSKRLNIATLATIIAGVLLGGGGKASEAVALTAMASAEALALKYTRENEVDADQNSLHTMIKAGYDPNGLITFLSKIHKISLTSAPKIPAYLTTHPAIENRMSLLENLIQIGPKPAGPSRTIGNFKRIQIKAFVEEREPHAAIAHFQSLVKTNPQDLDSAYGLSLAFRKAGRLDKSLEMFQSAHALNPKDPDLLRELGITYFFSGKLDQAIYALEMLQPLTGNDWLSLFYLGKGYQERGDLAKALPLFLKIRKEMPEFTDVYHSLGSVYGRMGEKGLSHLYFGKYFKLRGDKNSALLHLRTCLKWIERGSPEREEADREIRELTQDK